LKGKERRGEREKDTFGMPKDMAMKSPNPRILPLDSQYDMRKPGNRQRVASRGVF